MVLTQGGTVMELDKGNFFRRNPESGDFFTRFLVGETFYSSYTKEDNSLLISRTQVIHYYLTVGFIILCYIKFKYSVSCHNM